MLLQSAARELGVRQSVFRAVVIDLAELAGGKADGEFHRPGGGREAFGAHLSGGLSLSYTSRQISGSKFAASSEKRAELAPKPAAKCLPIFHNIVT